MELQKLVRLAVWRGWVLLLIATSIAQSGFCEIIPASRRATWQGNVGVQGGIPTRTTIFQTLSPGATTAQINSAIANCPSGQVVKLNAGTYNLSSTINLTKSNVTLRGAGPTTILNFSGVGGSSYINMSGNGPYIPATITGWTANYTQGTTTITVASASGFAVGDLVVLDQLNDPAYIGGGTDGATNSGNGLDRLQYQLVEITGVNGTSITFAPGLYMPNWSGSNSPRMWSAATNANKLKSTGLEDLKVDGTGGSSQFNIYMNLTHNCWVKNVESSHSGTANLRTFRCKNSEIRHSWFHDAVGGVGSYAILLWTDTQTLVEDTIMSHGGSIVVQSGSNGCVIGYNYVTDIQGPAGWLGYIAANHNAHPSFNLFEGNVAPQIYFDYIHGSASHSTMFRNYLLGWQSGYTNNTHAISLEKYNRYMNIVGNVLGKAGYHTRYEDVAPASITAVSIYKLGYQGTYDQTADPLVASTLLRHGNYDVKNNGIVWDSSISDHVLPNSYYLSSAPSWFGNLTWPPINPANPSGATMTSIPAGYRFVNGVDPGGTPTPTPGGTPTPTPAATSTPVPGGTPTPTPIPLGTSFASTSGVITSPFAINADTISQSVQTLDPTQGGSALYTFSVPTAGDYLLSVRMNCPDGGSNSVFVNIDAEPTSAMVWDIAVTPESGLANRVASWPPGTTPKSWTLSGGTHQLIIRGREANAIIGQITLSIAPSAPQGLHVAP